MILLLTAILVFAIDRTAKIFAVTQVKPVGHVDFIPGFIRFSYVENRGAAHGLFSGAVWPLIIFTSVVIALAIWFVIKNYSRMPLVMKISVGMMLGGAIGNLVDRIVNGYVVDMLEAEFMEYPVCNPADNLLVIGGVILAVYLCFFDKEFFKDKKKDKLPEEEEKTEDNPDEE